MRFDIPCQPLQLDERLEERLFRATQFLQTDSRQWLLLREATPGLRVISELASELYFREFWLTLDALQLAQEWTW